jgi:hypothetical protein
MKNESQIAAEFTTSSVGETSPDGGTTHSLVYPSATPSIPQTLAPGQRLVQALKNPLVLCLITWLGLLFIAIKELLLK